ncbi:MAG: LIC12162 family protein [Candidatus Hydrogenedentota bacterium]
MFLALTPHHQFWEYENNSITLLGEWCLTDETRNILKNKKYKIVTTPWKNKRISDEILYIFDFLRFLIPHFTKILNEVHNVDKSQKYWKTILSAWLYDYISVIYDGYLRLKKSKDELGEFKTYFTDENLYYPILNHLYFLYLLNKDNYRLYLFSIIGREMGLEGGRVNLVKQDYFGEYVSFFLKHKKDRDLKRIFMKKLLIFLSVINPFLKKKIIVDGISSYDKFILSFKTGLNLHTDIPWRELDNLLLNRINKENIINQTSRDVFEKLPYRNKFEEILCKTMKFNFPVYYLEKYKKMLDLLKSHMNKNIRSIMTVNWNNIESLKFTAASIADNNGKLIALQHGGAAGVTMNFPEELIDRYITDIYVSSGWMEEKNIDSELCKVVPLPRTAYGRLNNTWLNKSDECVLVGNAILRYIYRIQPFYSPEDMEEYFEWKYVFFNSLDQNILNKFCYRPYPYEFGYNEIERIKEKFPKMKFLTDVNLIEFMKGCRLVVSDHLATSYLESLIINVPTVLFWDKEIFRIRPSACSYFNNFQSVKILHYTPDDAAHHINQIFDNIESWWLDERVQKARLDFVNYLGFSSPDWSTKWKQFIKQEL